MCLTRYISSAQRSPVEVTVCSFAEFVRRITLSVYSHLLSEDRAASKAKLLVHSALEDLVWIWALRPEDEWFWSSSVGYALSLRNRSILYRFLDVPHVSGISDSSRVVYTNIQSGEAVLLGALNPGDLFFLEQFVDTPVVVLGDAFHCKGDHNGLIRAVHKDHPSFS